MRVSHCFIVCLPPHQKIETTAVWGVGPVVMTIDATCCVEPFRVNSWLSRAFETHLPSSVSSLHSVPFSVMIPTSLPCAEPSRPCTHVCVPEQANAAPPTCLCTQYLQQEDNGTCSGKFGSLIHDLSVCLSLSLPPLSLSLSLMHTSCSPHSF